MRAFILSSLAGCAFLIPSCMAYRYTARATERITLPYVPSSPIDVSTRNGAIEILGGSEGEMVEVSANIVTCGYTQDEAERRLEQVKIHCDRDSRSQRLTLRASFGDEPRGRDGVSYVVRIPDADGCRLRTSNGKVLVRSIHGTLDAQTSNGAVDVKDHSGIVTAATSNGPVTILDASGPVKAHTSNGKVGIALRPDARGPVDIRSSNGSIQLTVGPRFAGEMMVTTSNGRVRLHNEADVDVRQRLRKRSGRIEFSRDGEESRVRTSNGSVTVTIRE